MDLKEPLWTVVEFDNGNGKEISVLPCKWIFKINENNYCYWPSENQRKFIKKAVAFQKDWDTYPIRILVNDPVAYKDALKIEKCKEHETDEDAEESVKCNRSTLKRKKYPDFVTSYDSSSDDTLLPPPPKIFLHDSQECFSDDTLSNASTDLMPPPPRPNKRKKTKTPTQSANEDIIIHQQDDEHQEQQIDEGPNQDQIQNQESEQESTSTNVVNLDNTNTVLENNATTFVNLDNAELVFTDDDVQIPNGDIVPHVTDGQSLETTLNAILRCCMANKVMLERVQELLINFNVEQQRNRQQQQNNELITNIDSVPKLQFKKFKSLLKYDKTLQESADLERQLEFVFYMSGGKTEKEQIKRCLGKLFSDKLATKCSWLGRKNNFQVSNLKLIQILKTAVRKCFKEMTDKNFEIIVADWFRQSGLRYTRNSAKN